MGRGKIEHEFKREKGDFHLGGTQGKDSQGGENKVLLLSRR